MIAIDTNILVRLLVADHPAQYKASHTLFSSEDIFIPDTVILETEWVLRAAYALSPLEVCTAFGKTFGLPNVTITHPALMLQVITWHESGLDFADAMHLAHSQDKKCLKTFDNQFIKNAKKLTDCRVEKP